MTYPDRLIPKLDSILIAILDSNEILCRGVRADFPLKDETGMLSAQAIEEIQIPGYSTNKMPPSELEDIKLNINNKELSRTYWNEGENGYRVADDEFTIIQDRQYYLIKIGDIDEHSGLFPFPNSQNPDDFKCKFELKVKHKPLVVNYSHCEFALSYIDENGELFEKPSRKSQKVINANVRQKLIEIAKFSIEEIQK